MKRVFNKKYILFLGIIVSLLLKNNTINILKEKFKDKLEEIQKAGDRLGSFNFNDQIAKIENEIKQKLLHVGGVSIQKIDLKHKKIILKASYYKYEETWYLQTYGAIVYPKNKEIFYTRHPDIPFFRYFLKQEVEINDYEKLIEEVINPLIVDLMNKHDFQVNKYIVTTDRNNDSLLFTISF